MLIRHVSSNDAGENYSVRPANQPHSGLVYVFPLAHLVYCLAITFGHLQSGWQPLVTIDFPVSIVPVALMWRTEHAYQIWYHPLLWFGILGTSWWFFLSLGIELFARRVFAAVRNRA